MPKMFVTVLNYDTEGHQSDGVAKRKMVMEEALRAANAIVAGKMKAGDNGRLVWNIFAAPEYSFANPVSHDNHEPGDVRHLSEGSKVSIDTWLKGLSVKHSKTLIFPGSIAWKKPLARNLATYLKNKEATAEGSFDKAAAARHFQQKTQTRQQKAVDSINVNTNEFMGGRTDVSVSGDMTQLDGYLRDTSGDWWYETTASSGVLYPGTAPGTYWTKDPKLASRTVTHAAPTNQQKLNELGGGNATHMARNTSLIYLNGKKQCKYHKAQDYHEVLDGRGDTVYVPGNCVPTFEVDSLNYGVEICLDHVYGSLDTRAPPTKAVDIVVLMSAKVKFDRKHLPNAGAMVIHACSEESWSFVGRDGAPGAGCTRESPTSTKEYTLYSFDF